MRRIRVAAASLMVAAGLVGAVAAAASAAGPPPGEGLAHFGPYQCEGLGEVQLFGPGGDKAASVFTETGEHLNLLSLELHGTDVDGNRFDLSKTYGEKSGLTTFTCTQHFEEGQATSDVTLVVGLVPPQ